MGLKNLLASAAVAVAAIAGASDAFAAAWVQPAGATSTFTYSGGMDDKGLFGSPFEVTSEGFSFAPNNFSSSSANGVAPLPTTDRMQVQINALPNGPGIGGISLSEVGDYVINDGGSVTEFAYLLIRVLDADWTGPRTFSAGGPTTGFNLDTKALAGDAQGEWTDTLSVSLPSQARSVLIILNNNLLSGSIAGGSALIQKKFIGGGETPGINILFPEPTSLLAGAAGLTLLVRRRRAI